ncbi:hypothetical protein BCR33DRAFT_780721 [Rhizoclosmatium globosum]|uniref:G domain-containing protein n=1 Tax=Rhizoclosmatium globosum TaxID=329046 RepID=A0A1Y2CUU6_9FUNG|nr:hypothetical protein BCR33DRAFT_780721 [Rhizoclosmatium globosum]|eukprot:ORY50811.1 hypothetical protein BCR33DRAFT_780721 [Rhizoclosmatium globosum]
MTSERVDEEAAVDTDNRKEAGVVSIHQKDLDIVTEDMDGLGLVELAKIYGVTGVTVPKRKIWILLLGNHSAGKSSFINWYVDHPVQKTSVAIETTSFTLITAGKKRETFGGPATCQLFPILKSISELKGVLPSLATEIVPSNSRNFDLITFIDSPGLVDGGVKYPFDPETVLIQMANEADLVFSFFDPIGQALCARTMNVVEAVCENQGFKIHFYLSKADTIPDESDRQKVLIQIAQSLTHRIQDRQFSLDIPPIYIPRPDNSDVNVRNHLNGVLATIDSTIAQGVQKSLGALKKDAANIAKAIRAKLAADDATRKFNKRDIGRGFLLLATATTPFIVLISVGVYRILNSLAESNGPEVLGPGGLVVTQILEVLDALVQDLAWKSIGYVFAASIFAFTLWWFFIKKRKTLSVSERAEMQKHLAVVHNLLPTRHEELYEEYFAAHVTK